MNRAPASGIAFALITGLLTGCATPMEMEFARPVTPVAAAKSAAQVSLVFAPVVDARPESARSTAGHVGGREVRSEQLLPWIDRSLATLRGVHFATIAEPTGMPHWQASPSLRHFYASSLTVSKNANIVLELKLASPNGRTYTRVYRGRITSVNWWNATGEVELAFTAALRDCLKRIALDLDALVKAEPAAITAATLPVR